MEINRKDAIDLNRRAAEIAERVDVNPKLNVISGEAIGAAIEVHRTLGPGYLESVYEESMAIELKLRGIPFQRQKPIELIYKGYAVGQARIDLLVADCLIVELKAVEFLTAIHQAQALSYLKATNLELAVLINFNVGVLRDGVMRIARTIRSK